jgi:glycosyltransferase involved in cell wall biosynthesis
MMTLALIIPALNEEGNVARTIGQVPPGLVSQLIVVDNGSTDATADRARNAGAEVVSEPRRGYGSACLAGLARLRPDIEAIGILDADGSDDASVLPQMLALIERGEADMVLSARVLGDAVQHLTPQQRFGNWLACWLIRLGWGHGYRDMGPMRVVRRSAFERLQMQDTTWGWNVEMQIKAVEQRLRIIEIPVVYGQRHSGESKISGNLVGTIRAGTKILTTISRYALSKRARMRMMETHTYK